MIVLPGGYRPYRILAIDPGTNTLGTAILDMDLVTKRVSLEFAQTFKGDKMARRLEHVSSVYGDREAKLQAHTDNLFRLMVDYGPTAIISESPYMRKLPQAYAALVECLGAIRRAIQHYDPTICLELVDPPTVKKAVGAPGKGGDKSLVKQGVKAQVALENPHGIDLDRLDEHSIDAIAVGFYKVRGIWATLDNPSI